MRSINVTFADKEFEQLKLVKLKAGTTNWREFILKVAKVENNNVKG